MAEIYKQQIEHRSGGGSLLRSAPYRDYISQSLGALSEGFGKLSEYFQYRDDKELASKMNLVAKEVDADIVHWEDFSAEGLDALMAQSMEKYDKAMAESPYDAQNRFNTYNPEARNIFELKAKEDIFTVANKFVFEETQRDFNVIASDVSGINDIEAKEAKGPKDPADIKADLLAALDKVNENKSGLLNVAQLGQLTDSLGHKVAAQSIGQAIIDGRVGDAEKLLGDKVFTKFLGPDEILSFKSRIQHLKDSQEEDEKAAPGYKDRANFLIALRDGMYEIGGPEYADSTMNWLTERLRSGQSIGDQRVLEWIDFDGDGEADGIPLRDLALKIGVGVEGINAWDSTPMTARQLAINEYEKIVEPALPMEYKRRRSYLAESFTRGLEQYLVEDDEGKKTIYDFTDISNDELLDKMRDAEELQWYRIGLDNNVLKQLDSFLNTVEAKKAEAGKAISIELDPIQQNMAGFTAGKTFYGGGNLTEAMVRSLQEGEEKPSVVEGMMKNTLEFKTKPLQESAYRRVEAAEAVVSGIAGNEKDKIDAIKKLGSILASGDLAPTRTNLPYFDDGGAALSNSIAAGVGRLMKTLGEVDEKGNLAAPNANTYRFMTYAIPVILGYISVKGNEDDIKNTGIKPGVINDENVVDLVLAMQNRYKPVLNDNLIASNTAGAYRDQPGPSAPEIYGIQKSDAYEMLMSAYKIAASEGMVKEGVTPDQNTMISIAFAINKLIKDEKPKTYVPAEDSGAQKRLDYKTKAMQQYKKITKKGQ